MGGWGGVMASDEVVEVLRVEGFFLLCYKLLNMPLVCSMIHNLRPKSTKSE